MSDSASSPLPLPMKSMDSNTSRSWSVTAALLASAANCLTTVGDSTNSHVRLLTFAVGRHMTLPPSKPARFNVNAVDDPTFVIDSSEAQEGLKVYGSTCGSCHGADLGTAIAPDLRESALAMDWRAFRAVLHNGHTLGRGDAEV